MFRPTQQLLHMREEHDAGTAIRWQPSDAHVTLLEPFFPFEGDAAGVVADCNAETDGGGKFQG
jgi:hypothetical protein